MSLPALLIAFFSASFIVAAFLPNLTPELLAEVFEKTGLTLQEGISFLDFANIQILQLYVLSAMLVVGLGLVIVGPVHAGLTYILRNYSREEHAFVWMDFKEHAGKNLKQSLAASGLSLLFTALFVVNFAFYNTNIVLGSNVLRILLQTIMVVLFVIWCMMQMYLYPMMITFDLKLKQLLRNCLMFAILRLPLNILMLIFSALILFVIPGILLFLGYGISVLLAFVWYAFFAFGFNLFMITFFAYRALDKHMIQRIRAAEALNEDEASEAAEDEDAAEDGEEEEDEETAGDKRQGSEQEGLARSPS
jgi:uncharacterized membrane protein YesL